MNEVIFGTIESYTDLGLFLADVTITPPTPKRITIDVPGRDGTLDLTYSLSSTVRFQNRKINLEFVMKNYEHEWLTLFSTILTQLHGKQMHVTIEPDTDYYWDAFVTVDTTKSDRNKGTVSVTLDAFPYKLEQTATSYTFSVSGTETVTCANSSPMDTIPTFLSGDACTITFDGTSYDLTANTETTFDGIVFSQGNNSLTIAGTADVTVTYTEGVL